jgi:lipopolysaccharide/colanic/teichoic acid biosynthesis glycosyltransferase
MHSIYSIWKRIFDIIVSICGLLIFSPLIAFIAIVIKLNSEGPVIYKGTRVGKDGILFQIFKFRTMVANAERLGGPSTANNDKRLTSVGKYLRKYKLDELPQLVNTLKGEMSIVGPRPQVQYYASLYQGENKRILEIKPGLTDYASIEYINLDQILGDENVDEKYFREIEPKKNKLRLRYVHERSFRVDMKIISKTLFKLFRIR